MLALIINDEWDYHIMHLIKSGLSDKEIAEQIPFTIGYVQRLRKNIKTFSDVRIKERDPYLGDSDR